MKNKFWKNFLSFSLLIAISLFLVNFVQAQNVDYGLNQVSQGLEGSLGKSDLPVIVGRIIKAFLGLLGTVVVGFMVYAGFVWMTAGGEEEKISQAKKILLNSVIGLAIILSSYSITNFVLKKLGGVITGREIVGDNGDNSGGGGNIPLPGLCFDDNDCCQQFANNCCEDQHFVVKSISPASKGQDINMFNVVFRVVFSQPLANDINLNDFIKIYHNNQLLIDNLDYQFADNNHQVVEIVYNTNNNYCANQNINCLLPGEYKIEVKSNIKNKDGQEIELKPDCSEREFPLTAVFNSGQIPQNYLEDGNMEANGLDKWLVYGQVDEDKYYQKTNQEKFAGDKSMLVKGRVGFQQYIKLKPKIKYKLSFNYKVQAGHLLGVIGVGNSNRDFENKNINLGPTDDWQLYEREFVLPPRLANQNGEVADIRIRLSGKEDNTKVFIDNLDVRVIEDFIDKQKPEIKKFQISNFGQNNIRLIEGRVYPVTGLIADNKGNSYVKISVIETNGHEQRVIENLNYYTGPYVRQGSKANFNFLYPFRVQPLIRENNQIKNQKYVLRLTAYDIDNNFISQDINFSVLANHCDNGVQDGDETGVDVGGSCGSVDSCQEDSDCALDYKCFDNICVPQPVIIDFSPENGATDSFVSINGRHFGNKIGKVNFKFYSDDGQDFKIVPAKLAPCGLDSWQDDQIIVLVPKAPVGFSNSASIQVITGGEKTSSDFSDDDFGPKPNNGGLFKYVAKALSPGLCSVYVEKDGERIIQGQFNDLVHLSGVGFGNEIKKVYFGRASSAINNWSDKEILAKIPNLQAGNVGVYVDLQLNNGFGQSNKVKFKILDSQDENLNKIKITSVSPQQTGRLGFITIVGTGFGSEIGQIYLADSSDHAKTCFSDNRHQSCQQLEINMPGCGSTWSNTQIVARIPKELADGNYYLVVRNTINKISNTDVKIVINGKNQKPNICRLAPNNGPAPTPDGEEIKIYGQNLTDETNVYFWRQGADKNNLDTWLVNGSNLVNKNNVKYLTTQIPLDNNNKSMPIGAWPILVKNNQGQSNSLNYQVGDCRDYNGQVEGYHCCSEGADQGLWLPNNVPCDSEDRSGGYVWFFSSGFTPVYPQVVEACDDNIISPSPWSKWPKGKQTCPNAEVSVSFSFDIDEQTINNQNVKVYKCNQTEAPNLNIDYNECELLNTNLRLENNKDLIIETGDELSKKTWYHVELSDQILSINQDNGLGEFVQVNLKKTRPCDDVITDDEMSTAYCFDFRVGVEQCYLQSAFIKPEEYKGKYFGVLTDKYHKPNFDNLFDRNFPFKQYFFVKGKANLECTYINVDGCGWQWIGENDDIVKPIKFSNENEGYIDSRAIAEAREETGLDGKKIFAQINQNSVCADKLIKAESKVIINLTDPQVIKYWPNCTEACINTLIGAEFNRLMIENTYYNNHVKLYECQNETCQNDELNEINISINADLSTSNKLYFKKENGNLKKNTWYLVELKHINSVAGYNKDGTEIVGPVLPTTYWKFKTKDSIQPCEIERVEIEPNLFIAYFLNQKKIYRVHAYGSVDQCNPNGQELDARNYIWDWQIANNQIAEISNFNHKSLRFVPACSNSCLALGSKIPKSKREKITKNNKNYLYPSVCGDGIISAGEDCDIALINPANIGITCSFNCLNVGAKPTNSGGTCGDGQLQDGEECDPGENGDWTYCNRENCLLTGSSSEFTGEKNKSYCGSGSVTKGEECDINLDWQDVVNNDDLQIPQVKYNCSNNCLHEGSRISAKWCVEHKDFCQNNLLCLRACQNAISICGNGVLEPGEECEPNAQNQDYCSDNCLLVGNLCSNEQLKQCKENYEGCTSYCHLAGSSLNYKKMSLCGDGIEGVGEDQKCEDTFIIKENLGLNPVQIIRAKNYLPDQPDQGSVQMTTISVLTNKTKKQEEINEVSAEAKFGLQCGFIEYKEPKLLTADEAKEKAVDSISIIRSVDFEGGFYRNLLVKLFNTVRQQDYDQVYEFNNCPLNFYNDFGVANSSCCLLRPVRQNSIPINGQTGICPNTYLELIYENEIIETSLVNNIILAYGSDDECPEGKTDFAYLFNGKQELKWTQKIWQKVKNVFGLLTSKVKADNVSDHKHWCLEFSDKDGFDISLDKLDSSGELINDEDEENNKVAKTRIRIYLNKFLQKNKDYRLIVKSGRLGVRDINGVGIKPAENESVDYISFKTKENLCRLSRLEVEPTEHTFSAPNQRQKFTVSAYGFEGQKIVSIPGFYEWNYYWQPEDNGLFEFLPVEDKPYELIVKSVNLTGELDASVIADIIKDESNTDLDKIFSAHFRLRSFYCLSPWPEDNYPFIDRKFNYQFGYCADAGVPESKEDDLPLLNGIELSTTQETGLCAYDFNYNDTNYKGVISSNNVRFTCHDNNDCLNEDNFSALKNVFLNILGTKYPELPLSIADEQDKYTCYKPKTLKKVLYVNNKNDDVIGLQIIANPYGVYGKIEDWYEDNVGDLSKMSYIGVSGYKGLRDANNIYVSYLNYNNQNYKLYNNILILNINNDANLETRQVFDKLYKSLIFNINLTNHGYCLAQGTDDLNSDNISELKCENDFDCLESNGEAKNSTSGICSNNKTRFLRDYRRLVDVYQLQTKLKNNQPELKAGTYLVNNTFSTWANSWGQLMSKLGINTIIKDPLNQWTDCSSEKADPITCWSQDDLKFYCPAKSQIYAYEYLGQFDNQANYKLYIPFEFINDKIIEANPDLFINKNTITNGQKCSGQVLSNTNNKCGNGLIDFSEQCDPPNSIVLKDDGKCDSGFLRKYVCNDTCLLEGTDECIKSDKECGNGVIEEGEICDDGEFNGTYGHCLADCSGFGPHCQDGKKNEEEFCELSDKTLPKYVYLTYNLDNNIYAFKADCERNELNELRLLKTKKIDNKTIDLFIYLSQQKHLKCNSYTGFCDQNFVCSVDNDCLDNSDNENIEFFEDLISKILKNQEVNINDNLINQSDFNQNCHQQSYKLKYHLNKEYTCSTDCQSYGLYCGDGFVQEEYFEECDDGNNIDGDGCGANCRLEVNGGQVDDNNPNNNEDRQAYCGDGIVQKPNGDGFNEQCDLGEQNGQECKPEYNSTCTYCSDNCVLVTKDSNQYCGNGIVDYKDVDNNGTYNEGDILYEQCDVVNINGESLVKYYNNYRLTNGVCEDAGNFECYNNCQSLTENCAVCGLQEDGAVAKVAIVNPMCGSDSGTWLADNNFLNQNEHFQINLLNGKESFNSFNLLLRKPEGYVYKSGLTNYNDFPKKINSALACDSRYYISFGYSGENINTNKLLFEYRPNGGYLIKHSYIYNPPVPKNSFRIVLKYSKLITDLNHYYDLDIYNESFFGEDHGDLVNQVSLFDVPYSVNIYIDGNWFRPNGMGHYLEINDQHPSFSFDEQHQTGVYLHPEIKVEDENLIIKSITIDTDKLNTEENTNNAYSILIRDLAQRIGVSLGTQLEVLVYKHHPELEGIETLTKILKPDYVIKIKDAQQSFNQDAQYWQVLNLVKNENDEYEVQVVNKIVTDLCQVYTNIPNHSLCVQ